MEQQEQPNRYELLSPAERNQELRNIFESLPKNSATSSRDIIEQIRQGASRDKSETKRLLLDRLTFLLSYSYLTEGGKRQTRRSFEDVYDIGVPKGSFDREMEESGRIFGFNDPSNPGGFSEDGAKEVDKALYKMVSASLLTGRAVAEDLKTDPAWQGLASMVRNNMFLREAQKGLMSEEELKTLAEEESLEKKKRSDYLEGITTWRQEYIQRYNDEP